MKVIKRNGRVVDFDKEKIKIAIEKANKEVRQKQRATEQEIKEIITYIEESDKKRILVEDIQDIIEQKLMEIGRFELAKKYIVYRYTRALVRKQNTTDESILGILRKSSDEYIGENQNGTMLAAVQRDYIAGEVSKDLTKRMLLPEKISKANEEGILYFHNSEYFIQPIVNYSFTNIAEMLENGTFLYGKLIETPKSFQVACTVTTQIIAAVASNQYGGQFIEMKYLGKYLRRSYDKYKKELEDKYSKELSKKIIDELVLLRVKSELKAGIQTLYYQIDTLLTANGKVPCVTLLVSIDENDPYIKENTMIREEILNQKNQIEPVYTKIVDANDCKIEGKFNQGIVSINLPQIGIIAERNEEKFWQLLAERLELCKEALMCRHYALLGTSSEVSPIHWQFGAIARLKKGEKIDKLLYDGNSTLSLGYVGIAELTKVLKQVSYTSPEGEEFANKVVKYLKQVVNNWKRETNIGFILEDEPQENVNYRFAKIDKEKFGTIKDITDKEHYTK